MMQIKPGMMDVGGGQYSCQNDETLTGRTQTFPSVGFELGSFFVSAAKPVDLFLLWVLEKIISDFQLLQTIQQSSGQSKLEEYSLFFQQPQIFLWKKIKARRLESSPQVSPLLQRGKVSSGCQTASSGCRSTII